MLFEEKETSLKQKQSRHKEIDPIINPAIIFLFTLFPNKQEKKAKTNNCSNISKGIFKE